MYWKFLTFLLIGSAWSLVNAEHTQIIYERGAIPQIDEKIILPAELKDLIAKRFPGYRLPDSRDFTGRWNSVEENRVPFATIADFDKDKADDIAIFILGQKVEDWKVIVFLRQASGRYNSHLVYQEESGQTPQGLYVSRMGDPGEPGCVYVAPFEACGGTYCWDGKKFAQEEE